VSKTQIRGPQRQGAHELDTPVAAMVVDSYARVTTEEAKRGGQAAAAAILPLRRALWALAERLVPERLAAALRARSAPGDPTGRDGVRELRLAVADWLDPPPACRWCRRPIRPGEEPRACAAGRRRARSGSEALSDDLLHRGVAVVHRVRPWTPRARACRASPTRRATGAVERCGTLALYPAGSVDLATMAAALETPRGAASGYDVAADRDLRALLAAVASAPPRPVDDPDAWADEGAHRLHAAVAAADARSPRPGVPPQVLAAVAPLQAARQRNVRTNGRTGIAVQLRYHSPRDGVTRADLTQGAMIGLDRGGLDYDARHARFTTYAAAWARQGSGETWARRDLVGVPPWVLDLRRAVQDRLHLHGPDAARALLAAVESLAESAAGPSHDLHRVSRLEADLHESARARLAADGQFHPTAVPTAKDPLRPEQWALDALRADGLVVGVGRVGEFGGGHEDQATRGRGERQDSLSLFTTLIYERARALADLLLLAESVEVVPGSRPTRRVRRTLLSGRSADDLAREALAAAQPPPGPSPRRRLMRSALGSRPRPPWRTRPKVAAQGAVDHSPEQARERLAAWVAKVLELRGASGSGLLAALRHGAPVFVQVGSGGDDDEDSQGTDGAGGAERAAAVLAAPNDFEREADEEEAASRWGRALSALAALRASGDGDLRGPEMAEVVRRHHGLDSIAEGTQGAGGESFLSIGESGLACSGRALAKESVRKIYARAVEALRRIAGGDARPDLGERVVDSTVVPPVAHMPPAAVHHAVAVTISASPAERSEAWETFRSQADAVAW